MTLLAGYAELVALDRAAAPGAVAILQQHRDMHAVKRLLGKEICTRPLNGTLDARIVDDRRRCSRCAHGEKGNANR